MISILMALCLAAAPAATGTNPGGPERLAVLPVLLGPKGTSEVRPVFDAVQSAATLRVGLRVMSIDDYYFHGGVDLARRALACGSNPACMAKELAPFGARYGMVVVINEELSPPLVSLMMLDGREGSITAQWAGQVEGGAQAVYERVSGKSAEFMTNRGFVQSGRLKVRFQPEQAFLHIDEDQAPDLGTSDTFTLSPGPHTLRAVAEGHRPGQLSVNIQPGQVATAELNLEPESSVLKSPWLWVGVGAAIVSAAAVSAVVLASGSGAPCLCVVTKDQPDCGMCP